MKAVVKAPAKINFTLDITGKLPNGYHTVDMVMQAVNLYDIVTVRTANKISISSDKPYVPTDSSNTAYKAAEEFFKYTGIDDGADIFIKKVIPVQAGLAGGSTDAAGVLMALNTLYNTSLTNEQLSVIGARVGADVPFCIYGGTMLSTGIGTDLQRIYGEIPNIFIVLCKPQIGVSTKEAYALSDKRPYSSTVHSKSFITALENKDFSSMCQSIYNDFESLLNLPELEEIKNKIYENGGVKSSVSGSGPTVFGIFTDKEKASNCVKTLSKEYPEVYLTNPIFSGCKIILTE